MAGSAEDPGWGGVRGAANLVVPMARLSPPASPLLALRAVFLAFCGAIVLIGVVALFSTTGSPEAEPALEAATATMGVVGAGVVLQLVRRLLHRPLPCAEPLELSGAYRTRFFLGIALSEASALVGFAASVMSHSPWPYLAGSLFTILGFSRLAPTRSRLQREDEQLALQGCPHSLVEALATPVVQ